MPPWDEVEADLRAVWASPQITVGKFVRELESTVAERLGVPHVIAVSSCTSGLMLAIRALGLEGEVILPPFTWCASGQALLWHDIEPVMADVLPGTYTLDPASVESRITPRTTAIMPVTVFGVPPEVNELEAIAKRHGLKVIYDSAQAMGSTYHGQPMGGFGDIEVFSMSPTKVATSVEGGLITTRDGALAEAIRKLRDYGKGPGGDIVDLGLSARQSELHAVVGLHSVRRADEYVSARAAIAAHYRARLESLDGVSFQTVPAHVTTGWNYVTVFIDSETAKLSRDDLQTALLEKGIQTKRYFYPALHLQTVFESIRDRSEGLVPVAERASDEGLALPLYSHMSTAQADRVCQAMTELLG